MSNKTGDIVSKFANTFTSKPILQQDLKECKLRTSPTCMSVVLFIICSEILWCTATKDGNHFLFFLNFVLDCKRFH